MNRRGFLGLIFGGLTAGVAIGLGCHGDLEGKDYAVWDEKKRIVSWEKRDNAIVTHESKIQNTHYILVKIDGNEWKFIHGG